MPRGIKKVIEIVKPKAHIKKIEPVLEEMEVKPVAEIIVHKENKTCSHCHHESTMHYGSAHNHCNTSGCLCESLK